jgi:hypothetical protein
LSSGTSLSSWFPFTSSSVKFLKRAMSFRFETPLLTKRNEKRRLGFFTSESDLIGTVVCEEFEYESESFRPLWAPDFDRSRDCFCCLRVRAFAGDAFLCCRRKTWWFG